MEKKIKIGLIVTLIWLILMPTIVNADGGVFIDYGEHVYLPSQKAAIFWNGVNETLILSTKIATDDLANLAWVIPIPSKTKPEVEEGDIQIFYELARVFPRYTEKGAYIDPLFILLSLLFFILGILTLFFAIIKRKNLKLSIPLGISSLIFFFLAFVMFLGTSSIGDVSYKGVEPIEIKKVDIYDVAILKATNATSLVNWLNDNEYVVPETAIPVLQDYCNRENFWFVANRVNLKNVQDLEITRNVRETLDRMKEIEDEIKGIEENYSLYGLSSYEVDDTIKDVSWYILLNTPYESVNKEIELQTLQRIGIISHKDFDTLCREYSTSVDMRSLSKRWCPNPNYDINYRIKKCLVKCANSEKTESCLKLCLKNTVFICPDSPTTPTEEDIKIMQKLQKEYNEILSELEEKLSNSETYNLEKEITELSKEKVNLEMSLKENIKYFCVGHRFASDVLYLEARKVTGCKDEACFISIINICSKLKLKEGIATPLKFTFQPEEPFYPLKISSINEGDTKINVYVLSEGFVEDKSEILHVSRMGIAPRLENKHVTLLKYEGRLKDLDRDSIFVPVE